MLGKVCSYLCEPIPGSQEMPYSSDRQDCQQGIDQWEVPFDPADEEMLIHIVEKLRRRAFTVEAAKRGTEKQFAW